MEYIIDNSPIKIYADKSEFFDFFAENQRKIFNYLQNHKERIKSFQSIYNLELAPNYTIMNLFCEKCNTISAYLKSVIQQSLVDDEGDSIDYLDKVKCPSITLGKECNTAYENSLSWYISLGDFLFENSLINLLDYLLSFKNEYSYFPLVRPHYLDKFFEKNRFLKKDLISFRDDFLNGTRDYRKGHSRLIKDLGDGLNEFRFNYSDGIIRIFFMCENGKFILLNCFVKKQDKTPKNEIDNARELVGKYRKNN